MVGLVMAGVIWILFPFISLVLIMLVLSFIFTSIFLPAVDNLERRIHNRGLSVLLIVGSAIVSFTTGKTKQRFSKYTWPAEHNRKYYFYYSYDLDLYHYCTSGVLQFQKVHGKIHTKQIF